MLSKEQQRQINLNILKVTSIFLNTGASIEEVATKTGLSSSSVQRYLNDKKRITELLGIGVYEDIKALLLERKQIALQKGGIISTKNNEAIRDEFGRFIGNRRK